MNDEDPTYEEILEWLDPDWRTRFAYDVDRAAEFYKRYAFDKWAEAIEDLR